jgi:hypothetical protein
MQWQLLLDVQNKRMPQKICEPKKFQKGVLKTWSIWHIMIGRLPPLHSITIPVSIKHLSSVYQALDFYSE